MEMYQFKQLDDDHAELTLYGEMWESSWSPTGTKEFANKLKEMTGDLTVKINSPGGDVAAGLGIFNELKNYEKGTVTTMVTGFAASAASLVFLAGDNRVMPKASLMFIHNAGTCTYGDANEMRKTAEALEKVTKPSIEIYKATSNLDEETIKQMMDDETWLTADECLEYGFATEIKEIEDGKTTQSVNQSIVNLINSKKQYQKEISDYKNEIANLQQQVADLTPTNRWEQYFGGKK